MQLGFDHNQDATNAAVEAVKHDERSMFAELLAMANPNVKQSVNVRFGQDELLKLRMLRECLDIHSVQTFMHDAIMEAANARVQAIKPRIESTCKGLDADQQQLLVWGKASPKTR